MRAQKDRHRTQLHKGHTYTHPRTLNCCCCCWAGEGQTAVGSILHVASDRCDRVALKLGARTHLLLLPLFFSCCPSSAAAPILMLLLLRLLLLLPLPNAPWGHFWYILFFSFLYIFSTCTKHLPSIFADTFYTVSTFSHPLSPLLVLAVCSAITRSCCFICSRCLSECVRCPSLRPPLKHF